MLERRTRSAPPGLKPKDLVGIPWRVAFALQTDGWYLRSDIIWAKPNPMPESVADRPTKAHEYVFLLAKSKRYAYDADAIREPQSALTIATHRKNDGIQKRNVGGYAKGSGRADGGFRGASTNINEDTKRNARSVWTITPKPFKGAHFATFPPELARRCVLAGSAPGDLVLDPFNGAGTTGIVAHELGRRYCGIELNPDYAELTRQRFAEVSR